MEFHALNIAGRCFSTHRERKSVVFLLIVSSLLLMLFYVTTNVLPNHPNLFPHEEEKESRNKDESSTNSEDVSYLAEIYINKTADFNITEKEDESNLQRLMKAIIEKQKESIEEFMSFYKTHPAVNVSSFRQLLLAEGGKPIRNMIVSTWRSGSTFLAEIMQSHLLSYYHYEPLLPYGIQRIKGPPLSDYALKDLKKLFNCDYSDMDHYFKFGEENLHLFSHNPVWKFCNKFRDLCRNPEFLSQFCSLFPFQNIKTVRLPLRLTEEFLKDSSANILLLVRDPRGTIQSRHHRDWCPDNPDCSDPKILCQDLVDDYRSAKGLAHAYPKTFKVIRYEDMSLDIYNKSRELFDFFRLKFHSKVKLFLETHTTEHIGGVSSTFRDSRTTPFHWRSSLNWTEVASIQEDCAEAMKLWGYNFSFDEEHVKNFNPIGNFSFPI